jgi:putative peptidoglycan lipid II flippase
MSLFKSFFTVSAFTLLSRITGLVREVMVARAFGASSMTDAFNVAFRLPNLLRRLFAEGAFSQAFVPILAEYKNKHDISTTKQLTTSVFICLIWMLLLVITLGIIAAPLLVYAVASGFNANDTATYDTTVVLTKIMFPYIGFMSLVALSSGILNSWHKFAIPAFTPVLLNISFISFALVFTGNIYALGFAVVVGGLLQLGIQIPALYKIGMLPNFKLGFQALKTAWNFDGVKRVGKQMLPAVLAVSVAQISLIINTNIASHLKAGSVSWLSYADRLMEFPTAMLGVALSTILMSSLSKHSASKNYSEYSKTLDWGLQLMLILTVPCSLGLFMYGKPLCATLFHYGKFTANDVSMTTQALQAYGLGIIGLIAIKILAPGFYALQNIKTPMKIGVFVLILTQCLNYILVPMFAHSGLALSIAIGACFNAALLLAGLLRLKVYVSHYSLKYWLIFIIKIMVATSITSIIMYYGNNNIEWIKLGQAGTTGIITRFSYLLASIAAIMLVYFSILYAFRINIKQWIKK